MDSGIPQNKIPTYRDAMTRSKWRL